MASSRWKRLAFFDRTNLSLPPDVADDVIPRTPSSSSNTGTGGDMTQRSPRVQPLPDAAALFPEERADGSADGGPSSGGDANRGEYFSLAVTRASIPASSLADAAAAATATDGGGIAKAAGGSLGTDSAGSGEDGDARAVASMATVSAESGGSGSTAGTGVLGMLSTLAACAVPGLPGLDETYSEALDAVREKCGAFGGGEGGASNGDGGRPMSGGGSGGGVVAISPAGGLVGGNPPPAEAGGAASDPGSASAALAAAASCADGLILALVSSRLTNLVHCVDLTVRCHPPSSAPNRGGGSSSSSPAPSASASSGPGNEGGNAAALAVDAAQRQAELEDLDGWRGHFEPFARGTAPAPEEDPKGPAKMGGGGMGVGGMLSREHKIVAEHMTPASISSGSGSKHGGQAGAAAAERGPRGGARVVALAVCSVPAAPPPPPSSSSPAGTGGNEASRGGAAGERSIHVASVTDAPGSVGITVQVDPHLHLSCASPSVVTSSLSAASGTSALLSSSSIGGMPPASSVFQPQAAFDLGRYGRPRVVDIGRNGVVAVGTDAGMVLVYSYSALAVAGSGHKKFSGYGGTGRMHMVMEIPAPPSGGGGAASYAVSSVKLVVTADDAPAAATAAAKKGAAGGKKEKTRLFVTYRRRRGGSSLASASSPGKASPGPAAASAGASGPGGGGGVCCYDLGSVGSSAAAAAAGSMLYAGTPALGAPSARYDLDGREVQSSCLCDAVVPRGGGGSGGGSGGAVPAASLSEERPAEHYMVARSDGLYVYSHQEKVAASPIDGAKIAVCAVPPPPVGRRRRFIPPGGSSSSEDAEGGSGSSGVGVGGVGAVGGGDKSAAASASVSASASEQAGAAYALVAATDAKSGRDAVDVYDTSHKLVAFHVLLSPGHRALRAAGITAATSTAPDGSVRGGRSSAIVLTSGGSVVTLTEKVTSDKVSLLVQKNLYGAAISMAYADPSYRPEDITALYRRHAEHLYRKGDFAAAMDQYVYTIGSLEPSYVIFRYLDAPKIPLLAKYLEVLRSRDLATSVHAELLKTCYLKLNDVDAAEQIAASLAASSTAGGDAASCASAVSAALSGEKGGPAEALATICTLEAPRAAEALVAHGPTLARALPRETAGVVVALCDGTYGPGALADAAAGPGATPLGGEPSRGAGDDDGARDGGGGGRPVVCDRYPVHLFASSFLENPKLLRMMLAHCRRSRCALTPSLQRALLELTLEEWNHARRTADGELEKLRRAEAMSILTDPHHHHGGGGSIGGEGGGDGGIGDYEALVIAQTAGFAEGEVLLYERLQMAPMLLERYAKDGGERARRQMLAMCRADPELLADVLGYFVAMAGERMTPSPQQRHESGGGPGGGDDEDDDGAASELSDADDGYKEVLEDIREALFMARAQGVLPPVRVARILAGEGSGEFRSGGGGAGVDAGEGEGGDGGAAGGGSGRGGGGGGPPRSVPLSVALEYIGAILDESSDRIAKLRGDVEEYNRLCNAMEEEIGSLLSASSGAGAGGAAKEDADGRSKSRPLPLVDIEEMLSKVREAAEEQDGGVPALSKTEEAREEFWRELGHSEDRFDTVARFFARGIIE